MRSNLLILSLFFCSNSVNIPAQEAYNNCNQAIALCPSQTYTVNNINATKTLCPACEDDFAFCFTPGNTVWFNFTTNAAGGNATVNFSNLSFRGIEGQGTSLQASVLSASVPCQADSYYAIGNCESAGETNFSLSADNLLPNTSYFVVATGSMGSNSAAECTFDISIEGSAVARDAGSILFDNSETSVCEGNTFTAVALTQNCSENSLFRWYVNDTLQAETVIPACQLSNLTNGDVIAVETDCYQTCPEHVVATSNPISVYSFLLDSGADLYLKPGETGQLQALSTATEFSWTPNYNISDTSSLNPFVFPAKTTTYTISANQNGCYQFAYVTVFVEDSLFIPTTFSPNGDDINETWIIEGVEKFPNCNVQIFDRWGQEVFQAFGYNDKKAWDGTFHKGAIAEGVYFYIIELHDSEKRSYKGSITLIR